MLEYPSKTQIMDLGDRIKYYENIYTRNLLPKIPIVVRVDGRAFHNWTKGCKFPFDHELIGTMYLAAEKVANNSGAVAFYSQSDEVTFLYLDDANIQTQQWFGGRQNKIESISSSLMTAHFNTIWMQHLKDCGKLSSNITEYNPAVFDARAFQCPKEDVPNVFLWRAQDWNRNSLNMFCRKFFSDKQLKGKKAQDRHNMLHVIGQNWAYLPDVIKNGTFWHKEKGLNFQILPKYENIKEFLFE